MSTTNSKCILVVGQSNIASTVGGSVSVFHSFCRLLVEDGYYVIGCCHSEDPHRPIQLDDRVHFFNTRITYCCSDYSKAINRLVGECKPDLIVFFFPALYLEARLDPMYRLIPRLLMFHSRPDIYFAFYPSLSLRLRRYYINTHTQILFESFRLLLPTYIQKGPVHVVANGVTQFAQGIDYSVEKKKIVYFSRVDRYKGVDLLIEAMSLVHCVHSDWSIDVYGDIEPLEYHKELLSEITARGLQEYVHLMGRTTCGLEDTLKMYDFCLFPSRVEGFGIGLGEAMSIGLPAIGLRSCTGVNELILDDINGVLCDDTPKDVARAIISLIEQPTERERLGRNARLFMHLYDPKIIDMQWKHIVRTILYPSQSAVAADVSLFVEGKPVSNLVLAYQMLRNFIKKIF